MKPKKSEKPKMEADPRAIEGNRRHCHGCKAEIFWGHEHVCPVLEELKALLAHETTAKGKLMAERDEAISNIREMSEHAAALRAALLRFGQHHEFCDLNDQMIKTKPCNCGLSAHLDAVPGGYGQKHDRSGSD